MKSLPARPTSVTRTCILTQCVCVALWGKNIYLKITEQDTHACQSFYVSQTQREKAYTLGHIDRLGSTPQAAPLSPDAAYSFLCGLLPPHPFLDFAPCLHHTCLLRLPLQTFPTCFSCRVGLARETREKSMHAHGEVTAIEHDGAGGRHRDDWARGGMEIVGEFSLLFSSTSQY